MARLSDILLVANLRSENFPEFSQTLLVCTGNEKTFEKSKKKATTKDKFFFGNRKLFFISVL